ncbi:cellulase family glycosylhydrolase [Spirosoma rhododendri]|uniref:Cellulase family glycosylhydrolase n=1 Tax=Spirosoma rhododendri TaxID=2728024 RepID=A0A7L5DMQ7_9BACT|nr:cellulase family glycosylhydrolase [Spirosoma rhododendri]QJD77040.1 cellulase family glycosylhydrolase [Spirosoma rhododendri]
MTAKHYLPLLILPLVVLAFFAWRRYGPVNATAVPGRWSAEQAQIWYDKEPWLVGANFIPSTAINQLEMWQADTFDTITIDKELGYAEGIGMNVMRVFLHNLLWEQDAEGFKQRIDTFLQIADRHHIKIMFVLFDSCWNDDPKPGKQPAPVMGKHNSGWVRAPGTKRLNELSTWPGLKAYTQGVLTAFATDKRVLLWDLYNEPTNSGYGDGVLPLLTETFRWARAVRPSQPITVCQWDDSRRVTAFAFANSDVISFHNYEDAPKLEKAIQGMSKMERPLICTEYMARTKNSLFSTCLPVMKKYRVGAINWGLVKGKTNTIYSWTEPMPNGQEPTVWFHDIFRPDGSAFDQRETTLIRQLTATNATAKPVAQR